MINAWIEVNWPAGNRRPRSARHCGRKSDDGFRSGTERTRGFGCISSAPIPIGPRSNAEPSSHWGLEPLSRGEESNDKGSDATRSRPGGMRRTELHARSCNPFPELGLSLRRGFGGELQQADRRPHSIVPRLRQGDSRGRSRQKPIPAMTGIVPPTTGEPCKLTVHPPPLRGTPCREGCRGEKAGALRPLRKWRLKLMTTNSTLLTGASQIAAALALQSGPGFSKDPGDYTLPWVSSRRRIQQHRPKRSARSRPPRLPDRGQRDRSRRRQSHRSWLCVGI